MILRVFQTKDLMHVDKKEKDCPLSFLHHFLSGKTALSLNLPWGVPKGGAGKSGCLLIQKNFINGYSSSLKIPLFVGYKLGALASSFCLLPKYKNSVFSLSDNKCSVFSLSDNKYIFRQKYLDKV